MKVIAALLMITLAISVFLYIKMNEFRNFSEIYKSKYKTCEEKVEMLNNTLKKWKFVNSIGDNSEIRSFVLSYSKIPPENKFLRYFSFVNFVYNNITYVPDKNEFWNNPVLTFWKRKGDCDDRAILLCYLLRDDFDTYLMFSKNHTVCVIRYNCSEFLEELNSSLHKYGYYINGGSCYEGDFKVYYFDNGYIKEKEIYGEFFSPEEDEIAPVYLMDFESFPIPNNASIDLRLVFQPRISIEVSYLVDEGYFSGNLTIFNEGYSGICVTIKELNKSVCVDPLSQKSIEFKTKNNLIHVYDIYGGSVLINLSK